jgi:hypothetical protein
MSRIQIENGKAPEKDATVADSSNGGVLSHGQK